MVKTRLLQATCAVVMLAAMPAFAQTNAQPGDTGAGGAPNNPVAVPNGPQATAPAEKMGAPHTTMGANDPHAAMDHGSGRHAAMHDAHMRHNLNPSQDAAVDDLNDRSYQAALNGQAFNGSASSDMTMPAGSGQMGGMSGGGSK